MAKTSMVNREVKREKLAKRYAAKRAELKKLIANPATGYEEKIDAVNKRTSCRATPRRAASATAANCRAARAASTGSSASAATSCAKPRCVATCPASARRAGNEKSWYS